jgi:hypothetical protein
MEGFPWRYSLFPDYPKYFGSFAEYTEGRSLISAQNPFRHSRALSRIF